MAVDHNNPQSRDEEILIATIDGKEYNKNPQSRMEELLLELKETIEEGGGGGGTTNYNNLSNQPQVNGETLIGDKSGADLGLVDAEEGKGLSTNDYDDTEKAAVAAATSAITAMKDGSELDSFGDVEVALLDKADTSDLGTAAAKDSTNSVTSGSTDLVESGAVKDAIDAAVSSAYHHAGTKTVAQLTHDLLIAANEGNVYNITDSGTTTSDFIEGIGKTIDEGSNVGICKVGNTYMFDLLSGFVDTTNFVQKSETAGLLKNDGTVDTTIQGDVSTLKSGLTTLDTEVNGDAVEYPYADVITIPDAVPANLADCTVKIEPVQDLHGQSAPYVGGAGKNKLPLTLTGIKANNVYGTWNDNVYTLAGVTYTVYTDDGGNVTGIKVNGTYNGSGTYLSFWIPGGVTLPAGTYVYSSGMTATQANLRIRCNDGAFFSYTTNELTKTYEADTHIDIEIVLNQGDTVENAMLYPMIRLATEADATFAPYTNYCPISGHTEASVQRDGRNLLKSTDIYDDATSIKIGTIQRILVAVENGEYTVSTNNALTDTYANVFCGDSSKYNTEMTTASNGVSNNAPRTVTVTDGKICIGVRTDGASVGTVITRSMLASGAVTIQLEKGQTATSYVPYAGQTYTIALGDTIYGGTVDFDSGVMTVKKAKCKISDLIWNTQSSAHANFTSSSKSDEIVKSNTDIVVLSDTYIACSNSTSVANRLQIYANANGDIKINDTRYSTAAEFTTAMGNSEIVYELATPTTIQLTHQQIQLLKGINTLTASTGQISVTVNGVSGAIGQVQEQVNGLAEDVALKQNATDNNLQTTDKTVVGAVNELKSGLSNLSDYAIRYKRMPGNDGRHYSATISRMEVSRFGMLILVFTETGYVETIGVSVNNQNGGNNIYFSSERASYDRNTKTITIDSGANANAYPMIYYPASFISFS